MPNRTWIALAATIICLASTLALTPNPAPAQQAAYAVASASESAMHTVTGTIAETDGTPVADAEVGLRRGDSTTHLARTDSLGKFRFEDVPSGAVTLWVRRLGYEARSIPVQVSSDHVTTVFVKLEQAVTALDPMEVDAQGEESNSHLQEFYARERSNHYGYFIDEAQIDQMHPEQTSDALRAVPGVEVRPAMIGNTVRIRGCSPLVWVDGLRAPGGELDDLTRGADVAAIEIYDSQAGVPAQYMDRTATCGTILVWLRTN